MLRVLQNVVKPGSHRYYVIKERNREDKGTNKLEKLYRKTIVTWPLILFPEILWGKFQKDRALVSLWRYQELPRTWVRLQYTKLFLFQPTKPMALAQGYYPDIYSAQEKWQEVGQKISSALNRLALEIPLDLYCVVCTNIIEHTWEWVQLPIINTLC